MRKDAEDLLTLRFQRITLDEHYARLYGPTVMVHQKVEEMEGSKAIHKTEFSEHDRKLLMKALSNTPFEKYRNKAYMSDSPEHIEKALRREQETRFRVLARSLTVQTRTPTVDFESNDNESGESEQLLSRRQARSLWIRGANNALNVESIKQKYDEAKGQFKSLPASPNTIQIPDHEDIETKL